MSLVHGVVSSQRIALKARSKIITRLRGEIAKLTTEKEAMGKGHAQLETAREQQREKLGKILGELAAKDPDLNSALGKKDQALAMLKEVEPSI